MKIMWISAGIHRDLDINNVELGTIKYIHKHKIYSQTTSQNSQHLPSPRQNILVNIFGFNSKYLNIDVNTFNWLSMQWAGIFKAPGKLNCAPHTEAEKFWEKSVPLLIPHSQQAPYISKCLPNNFQSSLRVSILSVRFSILTVRSWDEKRMKQVYCKWPVMFLKYIQTSVPCTWKKKLLKYIYNFNSCQFT